MELKVKNPLVILLGPLAMVLFAMAIVSLFIFLYSPEDYQQIIVSKLPLLIPGKSLLDSLSDTTKVFLNFVLLIQFCVSHSYFLTSKGNKSLAKVVPATMTGTLYSLMSSLSLLLMMVFWAPIHTLEFQVDGSLGIVMKIFYVFSWIMIFWSIYATGMFRQVGVEQWWNTLRGKVSPMKIPQTGPYKMMRHPIYLSFFGMILFTAKFSWDHLLITVVWGLYLYLGAYLKEKRYKRNASYIKYASEVPPFPFFSTKFLTDQ